MEVTPKNKVLHKNFIGTYIPVKYPMFCVKLFFLLSTSFLFLKISSVLSFVMVIICIVLNLVLLKRQALFLVKFLLLSTGMLIVIWCLFIRPNGLSFGVQSCIKTLCSKQLHQAIARLWGIFSVGQLFAGCTTQYEILVFLRRVRTNYSVSVFVILVGNAFAYFIQLYQHISEGFQMRCKIRNPLKRVFYVLTSLMLNALSLISGCKKVDLLYRNRIRNNIMRTEIQQKDAFCSDILECCFEDVFYPEQTKPIITYANLKAEKGDVILLTGANGCGKTTFLNLVSGIIPHVFSAQYKGDVKNRECFENRIGMVFQSVENELFFDTVESQLCHLSPSTRDFWLDRFHLDYNEICNRSVMDFSSGEQQRLSLVAELLDTTHAVCLLDEPTAFLDVEGVQTLGELIRYASRNKIIIMVSHDHFCKSFANRYITIIEGVLQEGYWTNTVSLKPFKSLEKGKSYRLCFSGDQPIQEISFAKGDLIGLVGPNGCGKTTMGKMVFRTLENQRKDRVCTTMMLQRSDHQLYESTVLREMLLGTPKDNLSKERALYYLGRLGLDGFIEQPAQFLSGGQKRALVILCMLMQNPDVIVLDEPFSFLTAEYIEKIVSLLHEYYIEHKPTIIICDQTHAPLPQICDRIFNLQKG